MDFELLLARYIKHVYDEEGVPFVGSDSLKRAGFTEKEVAYLQELAELVCK